MVVHTFNPSTGETEASGSLGVPGQPEPVLIVGDWSGATVYSNAVYWLQDLVAP